MAKTLYVTDLDATLLQPDKTLSAETVQTLNELLGRGLALTYATARSQKSAGEITGCLNLSLPVITRNGTVLCNPQTGEALEYCCFTREQIALLKQQMAEYRVKGFITGYIHGEERASWLVSRQGAGIESFLADHRGDRRLRPVEHPNQLFDGQVTNLTLIAPMDQPEEVARQFAEALLRAKSAISCCPICCNLTEGDGPCPICASGRRDPRTVCVVADPKDVAAMERSREYSGVYHVLHGVISPMNHVGPEDLHIRELTARVSTGEVDEVIMATNPDTEGEATAMYLSRLLKPFGVKTTRLAYGIPVGSHLEFADEATLTRALEGRREI